MFIYEVGFEVKRTMGFEIKRGQLRVEVLKWICVLVFYSFLCFYLSIYLCLFVCLFIGGIIILNLSSTSSGFFRNYSLLFMYCLFVYLFIYLYLLFSLGCIYKKYALARSRTRVTKATIWCTTAVLQGLTITHIS